MILIFDMIYEILDKKDADTINAELISLLSKQHEIQEKIIELTNELSETTNKLTNLINMNNTNSKKNGKSEVKEMLIKSGYTIKNKKINHTQVLEISNLHFSFNIIIKESKLSEDGKGNTWYTFKPGIKSLIDFTILVFPDKAGGNSFVVLNKEELIRISESSKMGDGRFNIKFSIHKKPIIEVHSHLDLSSSLNSLKKLTV